MTDTPIAHRLKPQFLNRISAELMRVASGIGYYSLEKGIKILVGLILHTWMARQLGPEQMGRYGYITDLIAIFVVVVTFGSEEYLVKDVVRNEKIGTRIGTFTVFRAAWVVLAWILLCLFVYLLSGHDPFIVKWTAISGLLLAFCVFDPAPIFYQAQMNFRTIFIGRQIGYVITSLLKALFLWLQLPLQFFVFFSQLPHSIERIVLTVKMVRNEKFDFDFDFQYLKKVLRACWPIALTSLVIVFEGRMGTFFIGHHFSAELLGNYTVGRSLLDLWDFFPVTFASTFYPLIIRAKDQSEDLYQKYVVGSYSFLIYLAFFAFLAFWVSANAVVPLLFGSRYLAAIEIVEWGMLASVFTFLNYIRLKRYVLEGQTFLWLRIYSGITLVNLVLQYNLTQVYGLITPFISLILAHIFVLGIGLMTSKFARQDAIWLGQGMLVPWIWLRQRLLSR